jgi:hypothetical protein
VAVQAFEHIDLPRGGEVDDHAAGGAVFGLAVVPAWNGVMLGDLHPLRFHSILFGQGRDGLPLQRKELLHVVEVGRDVLAEEIGGVGALVLLQREAREGDGRPLLQEHVPDIVRVVVIAVRQSLDDVALGLMTAEREGLGLRQGEHAMSQGLFHLVA